LDAILRKSGTLPEREARFIIIQVLILFISTSI